MASIIKVDTIQSTTANVFFQNSAGTEYARFDSSGNMLVGTGTNGSASKLLVAGGNFAVGTNGSTPEFQVAYDGTNAYLDARLASGALMLRTGGSVERMRIDSSGNTFIGVASAVWDERVGIRPVASTGQVGLGIYSPSTTYQTSLIRVQSENPTGAAWNLFDGRGQGGGIKILIDGNGLVDLRNGQIKFPATQNASSDANTLDDYEEGTWTSTITNTGGTVTVTSQNGIYTKVGKMVMASINITIGTPTTAGNIVYTLPFAAQGGSSYIYTAHGRENAATGAALHGYCNGSGSTVLTFTYNNNATAVNGYNLLFCITYIASA